MSFKFERLDVWHKALQLSFKIHELTRSFPKEEQYILSSQIMRAADSIVLNIAEGSTGQTNPEFKMFLGYAVRSGAEVVACLYLGRQRKIITEDDFNELYNQTEEVIKMTQALRKSIS